MLLVQPTERVNSNETGDDYGFRFRRAGSSAGVAALSGGLIQAAGGVGCPCTKRSGWTAAVAVSTT